MRPTAISLAQDGSLEPETAAFPINIHDGICDDVAAVMYPLGEISRD